MSPNSDPSSLYERLLAIKPDGLSLHGWSQRAGVSRSVFNDIRRRGRANHDTIEKLLQAIDRTWAQFDASDKQTNRDAVANASGSLRRSFQGDDRPRDIPVVGTAACADIEAEGDSARVLVETMTMDMDHVVDHLRRPAVLDGRRDVYAVYFRGDSMEPRYEDGEVAMVDPKQPPKPRDYVIVQLRRPDGDDEHIYTAMAKRLVRSSASFVELQQFNPPMTFRIGWDEVAHMHRIIPLDELVAF